MDPLAFLKTSPVDKLLQSQKASQSTTSSVQVFTNPFFTQQQATQLIKGADSAAANYQKKTEANAAAVSGNLAEVRNAATEGRAAVQQEKRSALTLAQEKFQAALKAASTQRDSIREYEQTYGSQEYKQTKRAAFEAQQRNTQDILAAQAKQDEGGVLNWLVGQFKAEVAMEEATTLNATINQMQATEMQATQQLMVDLERNQLAATNAHAEEIARASMLAEQAKVVADAAIKGIGFNKEEYAATLQAIGVDNEVVNASLKRMQVLADSNNLTTSQIQNEQQAVLLETAKLNLAQNKKKWEQSETLREATERDWQDYLAEAKIPEADRRTFEQMVAEQQSTNTMHPQLQNFMLRRNALTDSSERKVTSSFAELSAGVNSPEAQEVYRWAVQAHTQDLQQKQAEWLQATGRKPSDINLPSVAEAWEVEARKYSLQDPKDPAKFSTERMAYLDSKYKEVVEFTSSNLDAANREGVVDLGSVSAGIKAQGLREKAVAAGADPAIVEAIQSGLADKILMDITPKAPVREQVESNIKAFVDLLSPEELAGDVAPLMQKAQQAARYQAEMYKQYRIAETTKSRFPNWRSSIIPGDGLRGKSSINLEDAGSLELEYRSAIIQKRAEAMKFNALGSKFLTERY